MRYNDSVAIVDDMPLLSQWIKKSRSEERDFLAAALGFEPRNDGVRVRCLTAWRRRNIQAKEIISQQRIIVKRFLTN